MHQILAAVSMTVFPCLCTALGAGAVFLAATLVYCIIFRAVPVFELVGRLL